MYALIRTLFLSSIILLLFFSGYSQTTQYSDFEPSVFDGSTVVEQVYSPALDGNLLGDPSTQPVKIYLPAGYEDFPENEYPVLYLLGGYTWDYNSYYNNHKLLERLNEMISEKTIPPMIVVTPNAKNKYDGSYYVNSYVTGNWEDYIVQDVIQGIENKYRILKKPQSRGLSGFSMGGYGSTTLGMKHSSLFDAVCIMAGAWLDFKEFIQSPENIFKAMLINEYRPSDPWLIRAMFAGAAAFAPDSTVPLLGRFPFNPDSTTNDSIWQKWLMHDPVTMLDTYKDSLSTFYALQMYIGDKDQGHMAGHSSFHQALMAHGIEHGYEVFEGDHTPGPIINKALSFFSEHLKGVVPTVRSLNDYYLEKTDILSAVTDMDGELYIVPFSTGNGLDSIYKYQFAVADALANEEIEFELSELEYGKYQVYAISSDGAVCNIPGEFCIVPDTLPPILSPENSRVIQDDSIRVSMSRDGKLCLVNPKVFFLDTLRTASEIMNSSRLIASMDALADSEVSFSTDDLQTKSYWIYGLDQYGIVTGPTAVEVVTVGISDYNPPKIMLYPNPATSIVTIQTDRYTIYDISVSYLNGQEIYKMEMEGTTHQIDLSSFQKGVYFITIRSKDFVTTKKIIKL